MRRLAWSVLLAGGLFVVGAGSELGASPDKRSTDQISRNDAIKRAQVWRPTAISRVDFKSSPLGPGAFTPQQTVRCTFDPKEFGGKSPKFGCDLGHGDVLKVKYGVA